MSKTAAQACGTSAVNTIAPSTSTAHLEEEAAEQQPALAHPGGLHKIELTEFEVLSMGSETARIGQVTVLLSSCENSGNLQAAS